MAKIREATVAGLFYPDEPGVLDSELRALLDAAPEPFLQNAAAIVAPHAGLGYAGDLAALAWKAVRKRPVERILVLSPFHRATEAAIYLPESDFFATPFGPMTVDRETVEELRDCGTLFIQNDIPHLEEHGIEVQLPFARLLFPEARLVPVLLGKPSPAAIKALAAAIGLVFMPLAETSLVVISTDLDASIDPERAARGSDLVLAATLAGDAKALLDGLANGEQSACGAGCLAAYLSSAIAGRGRILGRHDSAPYRESPEELLVHYAAIAFEEPGG